MALIRSFRRVQMEHNALNDEIDATYTTFKKDGRLFIQIDSYGRTTRQIPGKKSQTIQLDDEGAIAVCTENLIRI